MSEITRKPLFSFEEVEEELAKQRGQIAREIGRILVIGWDCPRTHFVGMESCDYCSGFFDAMEIAAAIARGEK